MSTDIENTYSDEQDVSSTTFESTNYIDHGSSTGRGPGPSRGIYLVILNRKLWTTASSAAVFLFEQADDTSFSTNKETIGTYTASTALIPAGELIANVALPTVTRQYTRITATWSTSQTLTDAISAFLTTDPQATYPGRAAVVTL